jgi:hypothetical protein
MAGRQPDARRVVAIVAVAVVAVVVVVFLTQGRTGLPRSTTCEGVQPGGARFRSALAPTTPSPAGGAPRGAQAPREGDIRPAFRPATAQAVYCEDLADPFVLRVGAIRPQFFAYGTNTVEAHVPVLTSGGIFRSERMADGLPHLPAWSAPGAVWAPSVLRRGPRFVLYYATTDAASGRQCISVAVAAKAQGPYDDTSPGPLVCPKELGGAIDPSPIVTPDGTPYLLWKADGNCCGLPTAIYVQPLGEDGLAVTAPAQKILESTQPWEAGIVEGPAMVEHAGAYYLFYSGNEWDTADYAIGYAVCDSPLGPCRKPLDQPWLGSSRKAAGPGSPEFFTVGGSLRMVFHAWLNGTVGYRAGSFRSLYSVGISFDGESPVIAS